MIAASMRGVGERSERRGVPAIEEGDGLRVIEYDEIFSDDLPKKGDLALFVSHCIVNSINI